MKKTVGCALLAVLSLLTQAHSQQSAPAAAGPSTPKNSATDYIIGPGDNLQVFVWRNPELTVTVPVRPDGKITTPLVEDIVATGKTPSQLARDMEAVLSEFIRSPQVSIIVGSAASTFSSVTVTGQVNSPKPVPYRQGLRILDVILASGGLTDFAAPNRAKVVRQTGGKTQEIRVKIGNLMNSGDLTQNLELQPGDVLIVPRSIF